METLTPSRTIHHQYRACRSTIGRRLHARLAPLSEVPIVNLGNDYCQFFVGHQSDQQRRLWASFCRIRFNCSRHRPTVLTVQQTLNGTEPFHLSFPASGSTTEQFAPGQHVSTPFNISLNYNLNPGSGAPATCSSTSPSQWHRSAAGQNFLIRYSQSPEPRRARTIPTMALEEWAVLEVHLEGSSAGAV